MYNSLSTHPFKRRIAVGLSTLLVFIAWLTFASASPAYAAVDCNDLPNITLTTNSVADLRTAIACANNAGTNDAIDLGGFTFTLTDGPYDEEGANGLPSLRNKGTLSILNGTIERDSTLSCGGSDDEFRFFVVQQNATVSLESITLQNGCAEPSRDGGAIYNKGKLTVSKTTFSGNEGDNGGAIYNRNAQSIASVPAGELTVTQSLFEGNRADWGGAIYSAGIMTVQNSTVSGNSASIAGGVYTGGDDSSALIYSTIANNSATNAGGLSLNNSTTIMALLLANNSGGDCRKSNIALTNNGGNIISDSATDACGLVTNDTDQVGVDPLLGELVDNGGPTKTHMLASNSPARDQIPAWANGCGTTYDIDQQDQMRPSFGACDSGAVELSCANLGIAFPYTMSSGDADELNNAIICANENDTDDTITLTADVTLHNAAVIPHYVGQNYTGLIHIQSGITIEGAGFSIERNSSYACDGSAPFFRLVTIISSGNLRLNDMALRNGCMDTTDTTPGYGGAIWVQDRGTLALHNAIVENNTGAFGGAISTNGTTEISQSTFSGNTASNVAGAILIYPDFGSVTLRQSTLSQNNAPLGAAIAAGGDLTMINSTLSNNVASDKGGGLYIGPSTTEIAYSTIVANTALNGGGGIYNAGDIQLVGTLIADNNSDCDNTGGNVTDNGHNLIEGNGGATCGFSHGINNNIIGVDPQLGLLADNGGQTQTHALLPGSDAIDAGSSACETTDQRDVARPQGSACDIGAYEAEDTPVSVLGDVDCSDSLGLADALMILQYNTGARTDSGGCPLGDSATELDLANGDTNDDGSVGLADALLILQCTSGTSNVLCPVFSAADRATLLGDQGGANSIFVPLMVNGGADGEPASR